MKRPKQEPAPKTPSTRDLAGLAKRARYVGSPEHKVVRWWGGLPEIKTGQDGRALPRAKKQRTTICPLVDDADRERATEWVREAIKAGQVEFLEGGGDFPRYVWYEADGRGWEGRCVNAGTGDYKGWPMEEDELRARFG